MSVVDNDGSYVPYWGVQVNQTNAFVVGESYSDQSEAERASLTRKVLFGFQLLILGWCQLFLSCFKRIPSYSGMEN